MAYAQVIRRGAALLLGASMAVGAQDSGTELELERRVKAAFVFNFVKFVTWAPERLPAPGQPFELCTVDAEAFSRTLSDTVRGKRVEGRLVVVREVRAGEPLASCHVAFAAAPDPQAAAAALRPAAGQGVLTVHEAEAVLPEGVVRFFIENRRVRFEVNVSAAAKQRLELSSRLLNVAERVQTDERP